MILAPGGMFLPSYWNDNEILGKWIIDAVQIRGNKPNFLVMPIYLEEQALHQ